MTDLAFMTCILFFYGIDQFDSPDKQMPYLTSHVHVRRSVKTSMFHTVLPVAPFKCRVIQWTISLLLVSWCEHWKDRAGCSLSSPVVHSRGMKRSLSLLDLALARILFVSGCLDCYLFFPPPPPLSDRYRMLVVIFLTRI